MQSSFYIRVKRGKTERGVKRNICIQPTTEVKLSANTCMQKVLVNGMRDVTEMQGNDHLGKAE